MTPEPGSESVIQEISTFVRDRFRVPETSMIGVDTELFREGIVDSMGVLTLIAFLEQTFEIQIEPQEMVLSNFETIAAMRDFVMLKKS